MSKKRPRTEIIENENSDTDDERSDEESESSSFSECYESSDEALSDAESENNESDDSDEVTPLMGWKQIPCNKPIPTSRFPLKAKPGITVSLNPNWNHLDYLKLFFEDAIMTLIMQETNRYAEQYFAQKKMTARQRKKYGWHLVTIEELWVFFGFIIYQGIIAKPRQRWYWTKNRTFETPFVKNMMKALRKL